MKSFNILVAGLVALPGLGFSNENIISSDSKPAYSMENIKGEITSQAVVCSGGESDPEILNSDVPGRMDLENKQFIVRDDVYGDLSLRCSESTEANGSLYVKTGSEDLKVVSQAYYIEVFVRNVLSDQNKAAKADVGSYKKWILPTYIALNTGLFIYKQFDNEISYRIKFHQNPYPFMAAIYSNTEFRTAAQENNVELPTLETLEEFKKLPTLGVVISQPTRILTHSLVHANFLHFASNMIGVARVINLPEKTTTARLLGLMGLATLTTTFMPMILSSSSINRIGASGVIAALHGYYSYLRGENGGEFVFRVAQSEVGSYLMAKGNIGHAAHISGYATGYFFGKYFAGKDATAKKQFETDLRQKLSEALSIPESSEIAVAQ